MGLSEIALLLSLGLACVLVLFVGGMRGIYLSRPTIGEGGPVQKGSVALVVKPPHADETSSQGSPSPDRPRSNRRDAA